MELHVIGALTMSRKKVGWLLRIGKSSHYGGIGMGELAVVSSSSSVYFG